MEEIKEKSKVTSYRLSPETKDKMKQQLKELGLTQEQYFNKVVSAMEIENAKKNSFLSKDTTIIESNLQAILNAFISICDSSNNLIGNKDEELIESNKKYKDILADKENLITQQKDELQEVYSNLIVVQNQNKEHETELSNIKSDYNKQLDQLGVNLKDKDFIVEQYKSKNDMVLNDLKEYKHYKNEIEDYKKTLEDNQAKIHDKDNTIKDNQYNINKLNLKIGQLEKDHKQEILNEKDKINIEKDKELLKLAKEQQVELNNKQDKYNKDIEDYQNKYKLLLDDIKKGATITKVPKTVEKNVQGQSTFLK